MKLTKIDLQLFSTPDENNEVEYESEQENSQEVSGDEGLNEDETDIDNESEHEEADNDSEEETDSEGEEREVKRVPLSALQAERKKFQKRIDDLNSPDTQRKLAVADKLLAAYGVDIDTLEKQIEEANVRNQANFYQNQGYSEEDSFYLAQKDIEAARLERKVRDIERDADIVELMKEPFYADAKAYKEQIYDICEKTGFNLKQAYNALRGEVRLKEMQTDMEQRNLMKRREVESKTVQNDGTTTTKDNFSKKLSKTEQAAARELGWSYEKYYKLMHEDKL